MASSATVTKTLALDVEPKNLGLFIGKKGSNFKKMIMEFKKAALKKSTEISPEEWSSVELILKFEKTADTTSAVFTCLKKHVPLVVKTLKNFVELHKKEIGEYQKKVHIKKLVFRVGAQRRFIPRMIGIGGSRVSQLKHILRELPLMESLKSVVIEEQTGYISGHFTNMGERGSFENILITLVFSGRPDFGMINKIMEEFVEDTTKEPEPEPEPEREKSPWEIIGVPVGASLEDIKKAYRKLAKEHHPDKGGDEELFKKISGAFEFLSKKPTAKQE